MIRGGSWNNNAQNLRSAQRNNDHPGNRNNNVGFRFVSTCGRKKSGVYEVRTPIIAASKEMPECLGPRTQHCA